MPAQWVKVTQVSKYLEQRWELITQWDIGYLE